ncbi:UNKNOWN [Stylonychia lemnae]|uniref:YHYH domain-containing protein n=1 Tax=Stylonychia lemnae TaxID=5949 RepID=A0A078B0S4_STYLE|nr:UNKNOWN [Stylonychia lemnae]|eukprot:CDW88260.1 UNKNOWN [Stylonychia lemnae]
MVIHSKTAILALSTIAYIQVLQTAAQSYTDTLNDCLNLISMFEATHYPQKTGNNNQYPYGNGNVYNYEQVVCSNIGTCPDDVTRTTCTWQRYLLLQCVSAARNRIVIATNSLPNHCYWGQQYTPSGGRTEFNKYQFDITFNIPPSEMANAQGLAKNQPFYNYQVNSQADSDQVLCSSNWAGKAFIDSNIFYEEKVLDQNGVYSATLFQINSNWPLLKMTSSNYIVGVARNGVFIFAGSGDQGFDAFFPQTYGINVTPVKADYDVCLGSQNTFSTYRYVMFSPCMFNIPLRDVPLACQKHPDCSIDVRNFSISYAPERLKSIMPIGVARDGRVIYGPYRQDGELWQPCDVDVCNGRMFGRYYGYVATMFHPYMVGCFGPGNMAYKIAPQCSANARLCNSTYEKFRHITVTVLFGILALSLLF